MPEKRNNSGKKRGGWSTFFEFSSKASPSPKKSGKRKEKTDSPGMRRRRKVINDSVKKAGG